MDKKRIKKLAANPKFIAGIYNYCDRWCERCSFTSRCMNYAMGQEKNDDSGARNLSSSVFWQRLSEAFRVTHELLEETLKDTGIELQDIDFDAVEQQEQLKHNTADSHACSEAARSYNQLVEDWFHSAEGGIKEKWEELRRQLEYRGPDDDVTQEALGYNDALEILNWYQQQIYVKVMRAVTGKLDEEETEFGDEEGQKDSDGSAKVALIGIDRSIAAWLSLRTYLPEYQDDMIDYLVHLDRLRKRIEHDFPDARAFVRPGFDEIDQEQA